MNTIQLQQLIHLLHLFSIKNKKKPSITRTNKGTNSLHYCITLLRSLYQKPIFELYTFNTHKLQN